MASMPFYYQKFCLGQNFIGVGNSGVRAAGVHAFFYLGVFTA
jgi:hypothetical protein